MTSLRARRSDTMPKTDRGRGRPQEARYNTNNAKPDLMTTFLNELKSGEDSTTDQITQRHASEYSDDCESTKSTLGIVTPTLETITLTPRPTHFPSYVAVPGIRPSSSVELVKGTACQFVLQKYAVGYTIESLPRKLHQFLKRCNVHGYEDTPYNEGDIEEIILTCRSLGLTAQTPLDTADNKAIEGWWIEEELDTRREDQQKPISQEFCGVERLPNWVWERSRAEDRDWDRFGDPSIGPPNRRVYFNTNF